MKKKHVIVIGAGPAGLAAALGALKEGAHVSVLEHMDSAGKKLLLTGNGQCNLSNTEISPDHYHGDETLIAGILDSFTFADALAFWKSLGVETETVTYRHEACGYLYPKDHKAESVRQALLNALANSGGELFTSCEIKEIYRPVPDRDKDTPDNAADRESLFKLNTSKGEMKADALIFATGSNARPKTGSDSSIYPFLKNLGIIQKTWLPALTALKTDEKFPEKLKGLRADASVTLINGTEHKEYRSPEGEVQFRDHYISGLPVLQLSRYAAIGLKERHEIRCLLRLNRATNKNGILPCRNLDLKITGTEGFEKAMTCSGGVEAAEIDHRTLQSLKVPGIYFAGEMIDVDGDCGGFNLHFAFASGLLAGRNAAK